MNPGHRVTPPAVDPLVGATVGSFRVVRLLGRGGMGSVYLAEHPAIGSKVAIKFLHESMAAVPDLVARFYDEARAVNLIGHENIVGIFDLSVLAPGRYYIVMEHLDGPTLADLLRAGPVPPEVARDVLLQLCDALHCAHEHGVVHRDLKPDNVFVLRRRGHDRFVKLVDFGIAKLRDVQDGSHTGAGVIVGTPEYMAPEQCDNRPVDARTDVYALGVMAYQLFTGDLPHSGPSVARLLLAHLKEEPRPPRSLNASLSTDLEQVVLRALAKRPEDRHPDMAAFAEALRGARLEAPAGWPVTLRVAGEKAPRAGTATQLGRAGLFVPADPPLPAPFSRVELSIARAGAAAIEVAGEVVRVVTPRDASGSGLPPGFAVEFRALPAATRAELDRLAGPPPAVGPPADDGKWIEDLHARIGSDHYEFLGLPPDAEMKDVQGAVRTLRVDLESLARRPVTPRRAALVAPLLARVALAGAVLGVAAERLGYDARRGNHLGVARCVAAGLADALVAQRRAEFLRERPDVPARVAPCLARARMARALGNTVAALAAYDEALRADPLDLEVHEEYWHLRGPREGGPA